MRIPISQELCQAVVCVCFAWGWYAAGICFWAGFTGLLRPHEMYSLCSSVVRPVRQGRLIVIVIEDAKTWRRAARRQHVLIDDPWLCAALLKMKRICDPHIRWFPFSLETLGNRLTAVLLSLGIPGFFTLASFRTGGATEDWIRNRDLPSLRLRGRWALEQTLEHYVQEAMTFLTEEEIPPESRRRSQQLSQLAPSLIAEWLHL